MSDLTAQIEASAQRFRHLIDGVRDEHVVGALAPDWTAGEIVRHLTFLPGYSASILGGGAHLAPAAAEMATTNVENLSTLTDLTIAECGDHFTAGMATLCEGFAEAAGGESVPFHAGASATPEQLAAICVGELEIHGLDLADAIDAPWMVDGRAAAMTVLGAVPAAGAAWLDHERAANHNGLLGTRTGPGDQVSGAR